MVCGWLTFVSCFQTQAGDFVYPPNGAQVVEDQIFDGVGLRVNGKQFDGLIIRRCLFMNAPREAILIESSQRVVIQDCQIIGCGRNGILAGFNAASDRLTVERCDISGCQSSGIDSNVGATNAVLRDNHIWNVGLNSQLNPTGHGIYWKAKNVLIEGNEVHDAIGSSSVGISVRSSGIVRRNVVHHCNGRHGISYYSNYPGLGGTLLIENNFVYATKAGISAEGYNYWNNVSSINIRFNTVAIEGSGLCIYLGNYLALVSCSITGNLLVNTDGNGRYISTVTSASISSNLVKATDPGFVDLSTGDLHLTPASVARKGIAQIGSFPVDDIDGDPRSNLPVSFGADE